MQRVFLCHACVLLLRYALRTLLTLSVAVFRVCDVLYIHFSELAP